MVEHTECSGLASPAAGRLTGGRAGGRAFGRPVGSSTLENTIGNSQAIETTAHNSIQRKKDLGQRVGKVVPQFACLRAASCAIRSFVRSVDRSSADKGRVRRRDARKTTNVLNGLKKKEVINEKKNK